jgi:ceramide glucosyltransferase
MVYALLFVACAGLLTSTVYLGLVMVAAVRFRRNSRSNVGSAADAALPAVTLLKPLHGMEPRLRQNLESFFRQDYPNFEIIFGVRHSDDPALTAVCELSRRYSQVPVKIVLSGEPQWPNAKVFNLHAMLAKASHPLLVISDSDVRVVPTYLREVTRPLLDPLVGMVTCLYRGVHTGGLWSRLEALGMSVEMTSGVLAADMLEGMRFALGPTMATRRDALERAGGFAGLGDYFADDYVLGNRIDAAGYRVVLSDHVIDHLVVNRSLLSSLQHQIRWAKSTRRSRPKGHVGTGLTYAMPFAVLGLLVALAAGHPLLGAAIFAVGILNRLLQCVVVGWTVVRDPEVRRWFWIYPTRDLLGFVFWVASFLGSDRTMWRGALYRLQPGGRMVREPAIAGAIRSSEHSAA